METLDPSVFQTLHDQYTKLKSLQKNDKICKETEPVWCANEAKILLDTMIANIENLMANANIGNEHEIFFRLLSMKCTLMYEEAKFLVNIENEEQGQEIMSKTLELVKEYFTKPEITFLVLRIVNHFSFLLLKQGEFDKPHKMLEEADQMYNEIKNENSNPIFYTAEEIFSPSVSITCKKDTPEKVDRLMTNNLLMLGFVHSKKGNHEKYAFYNHQVLKRQLVSKECEASAWAMKAVKLASYFISKQRFREARHHLSAACHVLEENEAELKNFAASEADVQKWEELQLRYGDVAKCWVKYGLFLFGTSKSRLVSMFYGEPSQFLENLWLPPFEIYPPGATIKNQTTTQENVNKLAAKTGDESIPVEESKDITTGLELKQTEDNLNSENQEIEKSEQSQIYTDENGNIESFTQEDRSERVENSIQDVNNNNENVNIEINEITQIDHGNNDVFEYPDTETNPEENAMIKELKTECTEACTYNKDHIVLSSDKTLAEENIEINELKSECIEDKENIVEYSETTITEENTGIIELKAECEQGFTVDSVDNTAESLEKPTITELITSNDNSNVVNAGSEIKNDNISEIPIEETDILRQESIGEIIPSTHLKPQNILNNALHILFTGLNSKDSMLSAANKTSGQAPKIDNADSQNYKVEEDKNMLLFPTLDLSARESQVMADLIETAEQARALFLFTHSWLKRSKLYFTLKDNPMEYVNAILDLSELYRYLAFYEEDVESQYSVQKRRADALETLSTVLREARPQCYVAVSVELLRELAEVQLEMMGLNLRRLYAAQEGNATHIHSAATDFTLHKMEAMADIHSRLEQFGDNLGHRAEVGDCLSEMSSSEISADSVSHYM